MAGESEKPSGTPATGSGKGQTEAGGQPAPSLMGSDVAAVAMAQVEAKKEEAAAKSSKSPDRNLLPVPAETSHPPGTPASLSLPSTRQGTPGSTLGERPATKASVVVSLRNSEGVTSPSTPLPNSRAGSGDDDLAQLLNPFSPQA